MIKIFADTHKAIASNLHENIRDIYNIDLDEKSLIWGSILPDISPKYKLIRHYKDESLDYIVKKIIGTIIVSRSLKLDENLDPIVMKLLSRKIGIISHYLADYVCMPHAKRWTFFEENVIQHIKYEKKLNEIVKSGYDFRSNRIMSEDLSIYDINSGQLFETIKAYIDRVVEEEYIIKEDYSNDLDFALSLNSKMAYFIIDTINSYSLDIEKSLFFDSQKLNLTELI